MKCHEVQRIASPSPAAASMNLPLGSLHWQITIRAAALAPARRRLKHPPGPRKSASLHFVFAAGFAPIGNLDFGFFGRHVIKQCTISFEILLAYPCTNTRLLNIVVVEKPGIVQELLTGTVRPGIAAALDHQTAEFRAGIHAYGVLVCRRSPP